ncbi:MAG: RluA family pseudouridine synthase [Pseudomonadota bacterium]
MDDIDEVDEAGARAPDGPLTVSVHADDDGARLDRYLADQLDPVHALSRARLQALIGDGAVRINGVPVLSQKAKVRAGDAVTIAIPEPVAAAPRPQPMPLDIAYEDAALIVVNKPAGLVVHPGAGNGDGTLVNGLLAHCGASLSGIGGVARPGIVHRLDRATSGLLVVAKTDRAHRALSNQFASHGRDGRLHRHYTALVWGTFTHPNGTIDAPIGRSRTHRTRMAVAPEGHGREAITHYDVERVFGASTREAITMLDVRLETGRTHQIRVHMASVRHPVVGDPTYASGYQTKEQRLTEAAQDALSALGRQALHAGVLGFEHPIDARSMRFEAALPEDMAAVVQALEAADI